MKPVWFLAAAVMFAACQSKTQQVELKTLQDSISYAIGVDIANNLKSQAVEINPDALGQGLKDQFSGGNVLLTEEQKAAAMAAFQQSHMEAQMKKAHEAGETNKKKGDEFLAANKKDKDVVTLPSGLQYKVITMGTGRKPKASETVTVHYRGTLIDGTEFDSSFKRGEPATFPVGGVIKGWTEALQLMPVGSKWTLFIPPDLAYGERGAGGLIGPNATLIFEVELLGIK
jgi:FKBP-type peptidyl-prolyl cis-trans isomerase FklB